MAASHQARIWTWGQDSSVLRETLKRGGLLAIPTESSYGLAADPLSLRGVEAIFRVKGRPADKPLPVVVADLQQAQALGVQLDSPGLEAVAERWPAALSLVVSIDAPIPASAGSSTLALRIPAHRGLRELLSELGTALTATSANESGEPAITTPEQAAALIAGSDAWLIDDGVTPGGPPSTLVRWSGAGFSILRPGRYSRELLEQNTGSDS